MNTLLQFAQTTQRYTYSDGTFTPEAAAMAEGFITFIFLATFILIIVSYIMISLLYSRIFKKAGIESWIAWVPFYSSWKLLEIGGQKGFWAILMAIPIVQFVAMIFMYMAMYNIGLKLGKSGTFVVYAIFLPLVWCIWLAFDKSTWQKSAGAPSLAVEHTHAAH